jgi:hypothetical protein
MLKSRVARFSVILGGFAMAASLAGYAVLETGAYLTDTHSGGTLSATSGNVAVKVNGSATGAPAISFANILPGAPQTTTINVQNMGTGTEDIYIVFDNSNGGWSAVNAMGAYGAFTVDGTVYDNLNNKYAWGTDSSGQVISTDPNSGCYNVPRPAQIKFLPHYIKVASALTPTASKAFDITFTLNPCATGPNGAGLGVFDGGASTLGFSVVAYQSGVNPTDQFNGGGKIVPLTLPYAAFPGTYQDR